MIRTARWALRVRAIPLLFVTSGPLLLAACSAGVDLPKGYDILSGDLREAQLCGRPTLLIADNQRHFLYGEPVWIRTRVVDQVVKTAIRSPELDLFAPAALEWSLNQFPADTPIIHLGDAMDLACAPEHDGFIESMNTAKADWFLAPGNHDGIYFGSTGDAQRKDWERACGGPNQIKTQAAFVRSYVADVLGKRDVARGAAHAAKDPGTLAFARQFKYTDEGEWEYSGSAPGAWLTRIAWHIDDTKPHESWVIQELTATLPQQPQPVKYILIDTANYEHAPALIPIPPHVNAGSTGDLGRAQLKKLEGWLADYQDSKRYPDRKPTVVLFGHHPFSELTARAQAKFEELRSTYGVLSYVSAHTHRGDYFAHQFDSTGWVELNIGSIIDWPLEFRGFRVVEQPPRDGKHFYTASVLHELSGEDAPQCELNWKPQSDDKDYYVDYTKHFSDAAGTSRLIFDSLFHSYKRMLQFIPTKPGYAFAPELAAKDDVELNARIDATIALGADSAGLLQKRKLLIALETFDKVREVPALLVPDPTLPAGSQGEPTDGRKLHSRYRLCQAVWASQDDQNGIRRARRENFYIGYPPRPASSNQQ